MTYVFDIDNTICRHDSTVSLYKDAEPIVERINFINRLYDDGNTIIFQTARGMGRFKNDGQKAIETFYEMTVNQLDEWGVRYHQLFLGKPAGDIYVDDKAMRDIDFFTTMEESEEWLNKHTN